MDKTARIAAEKIIDNQAWASIFMTVGHIYTKTDRKSLVKATAAIIEAKYAPVMGPAKQVKQWYDKLEPHYKTGPTKPVEISFPFDIIESIAKALDD